MAKYRPQSTYIGAWHYVLLDILYAIPVIGLIMLLVHAFSHSNENRRHYARSFFVRFLLIFIAAAIAACVVYFVSGEGELNRLAQEIPNSWNSFIEIFTKQAQSTYTPVTPAMPPVG